MRIALSQKNSALVGTRNNPGKAGFSARLDLLSIKMELILPGYAIASQNRKAQGAPILLRSARS
jgi:hypothetical protein